MEIDTSKICYGCFSEHDGNGACPHCGFDINTAKHPAIALPIGTILNGRYLTGRVLGVGGFGVTYLAMDMTLEPGVLNITRYQVPQMPSLDLEIYTNKLENTLDEDGYGTISVDYKIKFDKYYTRRNILEIEVMPS